MIAHGRKQISEMVYARKASEGGGAVRLTNMIRGGSVVFGGLEPGPFPRNWLTGATATAILAAFGQTDGKAVIKATNRYLNGIAATDPTKAQALAAFINEDPMMVCSLGLSVEGVAMPIRYSVGGHGNCIDSGVYGTNQTHLKYRGILIEDSGNGYGMIGIFGSDESYNSRNFTAWLRYKDCNSDSIGYGGQQLYQNSIPMTPLLTPFVLDANARIWTNTLENGTTNWSKTFSLSGSYTTPSTMCLLSWRRGTITRDSAYNGCAEAILYNENKHLIPFRRNNTMGMIDLETGNMATVIGTLTEAFYLPDGTPWTPSTP